jgi:hypothetical protein
LGEALRGGGSEVSGGRGAEAGSGGAGVKALQKNYCQAGVRVEWEAVFQRLGGREEGGAEEEGVSLVRSELLDRLVDDEAREESSEEWEEVESEAKEDGMSKDDKVGNREAKLELGVGEIIILAGPEAQ